MPISGVDPTPRPAAVYASTVALPRRPQDSLPSCLLGFGRTRLALASSHQLLLSHPASGFPTGFSPRPTAGPRVRGVLPKQWAMADAPSNTDRRPSSPRGKASSEASGYAGAFQAHRQSPVLGSVQSTPAARALAPARMTPPPRSYGALRLPSDPPPVRRRGCQPPVETGLPRWPASAFRRAVPRTPADRDGCMCRLLPRSHVLPRFPGGSASASSLSRPAQASRALRPAGLLNRPRRPLSRGSSPVSCPTKPLVSYRSNRQLSGWNPPPLVIRAVGAHWVMRAECSALPTIANSSGNTPYRFSSLR